MEILLPSYMGTMVTRSHCRGLRGLPKTRLQSCFALRPQTQPALVHKEEHEGGPEAVLMRPV